MADTPTTSGNNTNSGQSVTTTAAEQGATANTGANVNQLYFPKQNNGQWVAMGSMVGTIAGMMYSSDVLDKAKDAEDTWRTLTDEVKTKGETEFGTHAEMLTPCNDALWTKLCAFATAGYCPDYQFILNNAVATGRAALDAQLRSLRVNSRRYNTGQNADVMSRLRAATIMSVVTGTIAANEQARQYAWSANWDMLQGAAREVEAARLGRIEMGGALIAGAGKNYANLAQSLRQTAAMDVGDLATLGAMLGVILPILIAFGCDPKIGCE